MSYSESLIFDNIALQDTLITDRPYPESLTSESEQVVSSFAELLADNEQLVRSFTELVADYTRQTEALDDALAQNRQFAQEFSKLKSQNTQLAYEATHDVLTGLPNRRWLMFELGKLVDTNAGNFSILFVDCNGLKKINDEEGHAVGNILIQQTANILQSSVRSVPRARKEIDEKGHQDEAPDSIVRAAVRLGGDEFIIVLQGVNTPQQLEATTARVMSNLEAAGISVSMGGRIHVANESAEELLSAADKAMYEVKMKARQDEIEKRWQQLPPNIQAKILQIRPQLEDLRIPISKVAALIAQITMAALET